MQISSCRLNEKDYKEYVMQYRKLGITDIDIPVIGLGTMTWGQQNNLEQACEQMDYALSLSLIHISEPTRPY